MAKKTSVYALIILIILSFVLTSCGTSNVIDSKVRNAVSGTSRSDEAVEWLVANEGMIIPELINRMSYSSLKKARQSADALLSMGDVGREGAIRLFDTMTVEGRSMWCTVLAEQKTKDAVLELLILSLHEGSFDMAVSALISMGDTALDYLAGQLHSDYYAQTVDTVLANFGEKAVKLIIPAVHSTDKDKVGRALVILATIGESAATELAKDALVNSKNAEEAKKIAEVMLKKYPETSINAIISSVDDSTDASIASVLLYEISGTDYIASVMSEAGSSSAPKIGGILKEYVKLCGVEPIVHIALSGGEAAAEGAKKALQGGEYDKEVLSALLNAMQEADAQGSSVDNMAASLIGDGNMQIFAHSVIRSDAQAFAQLAAGGIAPAQIGEILGGAAQNPAVYNRMLSMVQTLQGEQKLAVMTSLAACNDTFLPTIVLNMYSSGGDSGILAAQALTSAPTSGGKFMFSDINMTPYAAKITQGLNSSDATEKSYAQIILSRVSEAKSNNEFYNAIFASYKDKTVFTILSGHYGGAGAVPLDLTVDAGGAQTVPKTVVFKKTGDVKNVSASNEPDYSSLITGFAPYVGWSQVESGGDITLEFNCDITPRSKRYSGLLAASYLGAEASGTLTVYVNGEKVKSSKGSALIMPPEDYPGPSGEFRYKSDPQDAPASDVYVICFINAMYNMWGEKALFGLYNYDANATNQASDGLFTN